MNTSLNARRGVRRMGAGLLALFFVLAGHAPVLGATSEATAAESQRAATSEAPAARAQQAPQAQAATDDAIVIRNDAPGYNGYAGTWRDPETGDIVTSVIAPRRPQEQAQQQPIYIAPQIDPAWPGNGYGNSGWNSGWPSGWPSGWNGGWQQGGNAGWNAGWPNGGRPGWRPPQGPNPAPNAGWGQSWRPGGPGGMGPNQILPGQRPPDGLRPGGVRPPSAMTPAQSGQPGWKPPQRPDAPGPGGLPLPDMRPLQDGAVPGAPQNPAGAAPGEWQGAPPAWRPSGWQPGGWQPNWQSGWGQAPAQAGAWRPWGASGTGVKAWTPGQPPHGDWQPLSWSPGPAGMPGTWNPWQPYGQAQSYGMLGGMAGGMWGGMRPGPGMRPRLLGMPQLPPNITRHLGPVVSPGPRGGAR
ncbi:hypothetical protein [Desulfovibrio sp.]|uniref:hypothetical protein n=1 Tax=Desulfovibrio sp. TaxID=885 RepID=UPI0023C86F7F|nr:hypothetical protein [Desulfovibrio sp.]MDE7241898.1 hypothetical protein [Desulfovibrio sp.]